MSFFLSPKFWLPLIAVLAIEWLFAAGLWEPLIKPKSYAGRAVSLKSALGTLEADAPYYMTLGNSLALFGIEHTAMYESAEKQGARHYRMALAGAHVATLKMQTQWALENLPNIKGMVIGVGIRSFRSAAPRYYELNATAPFRSVDQIPFLVEHIGVKVGETRSYGTISAMLNYREDVADLLRAPKKRLDALRWESKNTPDEALLYQPAPSINICPIDFSSAQHCVKRIDQLRATNAMPELLKADEVRRECSRVANASNRPVPRAQAEKVTEIWRKLLSDLSVSTRVVMVLMPVHPMIRRDGLPENLHDVALNTLQPLVDEGNVELLDLTTLLDEQEALPCHYLQDLLHAGPAGRKLITQTLQTYLDEIGFYQVASF